MKFFSNSNKRVEALLEALAEAVIIVCVLYIICWPVKVVGGSMSPNYKAGNRVLISRVLAFMGKFDRFDVVVCSIDEFNENVIKRLIGLPGDSIEIQGGRVYINGELIDEPYVKDNYTDGHMTVLLGENEYFIMGDDRTISFDSRRTGTISRENIKGKVIFKIFPFGTAK